MPRAPISQATDESLNGESPDEETLSAHATPRDAALFIDWENLKYSLRDLGRVPNISSILDAARERGRVVAARAYADWVQGGHHLDPPNLYRAGISPVYIPSRMGSESKILKNSADVKLAVDTIDYAHAFPHVQVFVIVSGDADLVHLAGYLRMQGKYVIAVGVSGASSVHLAESVDEFLLYDVDIDPLRERHQAPVRQGTQQKRALDRMFNNLVTVVKRESRDGQGALFSAIASDLRHRYDFQPRRFGVAGFKQFMQEAQEQNKIKIVTEGMQDWAYLPEDWEALESGEDSGSTNESDDADSMVRLTDLSGDDLRNLVRFIEDLDSKSKYLRMPYVVAKLRSSSALPSLSRAQVKSLLKDAQAQGVFRPGSREVKSHATGEPIELDTLEFDRTHQLVTSALAETGAS